MKFIEINQRVVTLKFPPENLKIEKFNELTYANVDAIFCLFLLLLFAPTVSAEDKQMASCYKGPSPVSRFGLPDTKKVAILWSKRGLQRHARWLVRWLGPAHSFGGGR